jgi:flavin reductase (DIM6/NTAB) family NADH-FMN oxidoreductase RutF
MPFYNTERRKMMKKEINVQEARKLINSGGLVLVTAADGDNKNIATVAWHMPVSSEPPLIGVALAKEHYTSELILVSEEFTINIPNWAIMEKAIYCGSVSGRNENKFEKTGLTPEASVKLVESPRIKECIGNIECDLYETIDVGDHYLFIGQVVYAEAEEDIFTDSTWDSQKAELIYHLGGRYFTKSGERIASE